jgi:hypothetical protein
VAEFSFEPIWRKIYLILHVADVSALRFFFFSFVSGYFNNEESPTSRKGKIELEVFVECSVL